MKKHIKLILTFSLVFMLGCDSKETDKGTSINSGSTPLTLHNFGVAKKYSSFTVAAYTDSTILNTPQSETITIRVNLQDGSANISNLDCPVSKENIIALNQFLGKAQILKYEEVEHTNEDINYGFISGNLYYFAEFSGDDSNATVVHYKGSNHPYLFSNLHLFNDREDYENFALVIRSYMDHSCLDDVE